MFYFYRYNFASVFPIKVSFLLYLHKCSVYLIEGSFNKSCTLNTDSLGEKVLHKAFFGYSTAGLDESTGNNEA